MNLSVSSTNFGLKKRVVGFILSPKRLIFLAICCIVFTVFAFEKFHLTPAYAATGINRTINFQGKVVNSNGTNVADGQYTFVFKLYDASSAGSNLWTETQNNVQVTAGVFRVSLGSVTTFSSAGVDFNTDNLYLSVNFNADGEMDPRIRFAAVPYAINAEKVSGLTVTSTTGTFTLANSKTFTVNNTLGLSGTDGTTFTFPNSSDTVVTLTASQELTNKTIGSTGLTFSGATTDITTASNEDFTVTPNGTGNINLTGDFNSQVLIGATGATTEFPLLVKNGIGNNAALAVDNLNSGDIFTASSAGITKFIISSTGALTSAAYTNDGGILYTSTTGLIAQTSGGSDGNCLTFTGGAPAWGSCGAGSGSSNWTLSSSNGTIYPINATLDVLVGGISTQSAVFSVLGVAAGTNPSASVSATQGANATKGIYLSGDGSLQSVRNNTLTLGGSTTGNINLKPLNGDGTGIASISGNLIINPVNGNGGRVGIGIDNSSEHLALAGGNFVHTASGSPTLKGMYDTTGGFARSVYVSGKYAYVAGDVAGIWIFDVSNPSSPQLVGNNTFGGGSSCLYIYVSGKYAYVTCGTNLRIVDISNPLAPQLITTFALGDSGGGLYVSGKYAYVTADDVGGLEIINISDPTSPTLAGTYDTAGFANNVYVSGKYAYVGDSSSGLQIIDISNPAAPTLIGTYDTAGLARGVYVSGRYAYVADTASGLQIIDIINPASPSLVATYATPGSARVVNVSGRYAYITEDDSGIEIIDISNPASPFHIGSYVTPDTARGLYLSGKYLYVADDGSGLLVLDINGIETPSLYAGNARIDDLTISENADIGNSLYVRNGLNIGIGGLLSNGAFSFITASGAGNLIQGAPTGKALLTLNQTGTQDVLSASASGTTVFTVKQTSVVIGNSTNGLTFDYTSSGPTYTGTARPTKKITLSPEYAGAVLTAYYGAGTDTNITGSMTSDTDTTQGTSIRNYYSWESSQTAAQHYYTVAVRVTLPEDFSAWATSNALQVSYITENATNTQSDLDVRVYNENSATIVASSTDNSSTSWTTVSIDDSVLDDNTSSEWDAAGETVVIYLRMGSQDGDYVRVGDIVLNYLAKF